MFSVQQRPDSFEGALYNRVLLLVCLPILNLFFVRAKIGFVSPSLVHHLSKVFGAVLSQVQALLFFQFSCALLQRVSWLMAALSMSWFFLFNSGMAEKFLHREIGYKACVCCLSACFHQACKSRLLVILADSCIKFVSESGQLPGYNAPVGTCNDLAFEKR